MEDWGDFTLHITVMPPEPAVDDELLPTRPFRKPTLDQLQPRAKALVDSKPMAMPLPLRSGTLHSVAGLPLPPTGPRAAPALTPPPRATLDSLRATRSPASGGTTRPSTIVDGPQQARCRPSTIVDGPQQARCRLSTIVDGPQQARCRPSSRLTPAFGTRLTPPTGSRATKTARSSRPAAARRSRWARELLQRFNFDDCA
jgi:hypothetical protein